MNTLRSSAIGLVLCVAAGVALWSRDASEIANWSIAVLGPAFLVLLVSLLLISAFSLVRLMASRDRAEEDFWVDVGVQAANGVMTLVLTFTLLGISLGIGTLAGQELTPETVRAVIQDLTANFSRAFLTTVIGLPVSAALRAVLLITHGRRRLAAPRAIQSNKGFVP